MARLKAAFALSLGAAGVSYFVTIFKSLRSAASLPKRAIEAEHGQA